jgi:hypothetical protein
LININEVKHIIYFGTEIVFCRYKLATTSITWHLASIPPTITTNTTHLLFSPHSSLSARICLQMTVSCYICKTLSSYMISTRFWQKTRASRSMKFNFGFISGIIKNIWKCSIKLVQLVVIKNIIKVIRVWIFFTLSLTTEY